MMEGTGVHETYGDSQLSVVRTSKSYKRRFHRLFIIWMEGSLLLGGYVGEEMDAPEHSQFGRSPVPHLVAGGKLADLGLQGHGLHDFLSMMENGKKAIREKFEAK
ncbi:hypothetical protein SAY86_031529 [Trapa natans]|uniref:Uncharacterized protein n=1 Tax=Trapa natans TaxID=22666 RepID=A0AAN7R8D2_TRANT|nr:hypothetical protein SAY86_031529 [Trapa natans]